MKIGILADSHDNVPMIRAAVGLFRREGVDHVLHAGDFVSPFALEPLRHLACPVTAVFGNNDGERVGLAGRFADIGEVHPNLAELTLADRRIGMVHYPELALPMATSGKYDVVVYGHTHEIDERRMDALLLNPGEVGGWLTGRSTVVLLDLESLVVDLRDLATENTG